MILVVGIGHPDRGDDAVGLEVAAALAGRVPDDVVVLGWVGDPSALLSRREWADADLAVVVDAARSGAPVGTVSRIDPTEGPLPTTRVASSHALGLEDLLALSHLVGTGPDRVVIYAIEGERFALGDALSPKVDGAVEAVATLVLLEVSGEAATVGA